jgi:aminoglycoside 3-N-acetyltransferase I
VQPLRNRATRSEWHLREEYDEHRRREVHQSTYGVKRLHPSDLDLMRQLLAVYAEAFDDPATYLNSPPSNEYLGRLLGKPDFITVVALDDGSKVAGGLSAYVLEKFESERSEIYIYDLAVLPQHRRRGVATALIGELVIVGREVGAYVLYVQADLVDGPAIALYSRVGRREDVLHFDIDVAAPIIAGAPGRDVT